MTTPHLRGCSCVICSAETRAEQAEARAEAAEAERDALLKPLKEELMVIHARGYPDPHRPWPQTRKYARRFVQEHGGTIRHRLVSEWKNLRDA